MSLVLPVLLAGFFLPQGQQFEPPLPRSLPLFVASTPVPGALRAAVLRSWSQGGASAWQELNQEWSQYGPVPIAVDTSLGNRTITYATLVASGADVVILSDPAGGNVQYSPAEIADLAHYVEDGHGLIGTYATFYWNENDNGALAPLFGFASAPSFQPATTTPGISNQFRVVRTSPLLRGLLLTNTGTARGRTWNSHGYPFTQTQGDRRWDADELGAARLVAQCDNRLAILSVYDAPTYSAIYVSNMPEYFGGRDDKQLLYNAITYKHP